MTTTLTELLALPPDVDDANAADRYWVRYIVNGLRREAGPYATHAEARSHCRDIRGYEGVTLAVVDDWWPRITLARDRDADGWSGWWRWQVMLCPDGVNEFVARGMSLTEAEANQFVARVVRNMRKH